MSKESRKLRDKLDEVFSIYIRRRAFERVHGCERCGAGKVHLGEIQCSHYVPREPFATRWDERNAAGLCGGCHQHIDKHSRAKEDFFKRLVGEDVCDELVALGCSGKKVDKEELICYYKTKLKEME